MAKKRASGTGSVVKLKHRDDAGKIVLSRYWYVLYRAGGKQVRESSETESKMEAEALLQCRLGEAGLGIKPAQDVKGVTFDDLAAAYTAQQREDGATLFPRADGTEYVRGIPNLEAFFKGMRATTITSDSVRAYIASRREAKIADATIRRELVVLRAMFNQARKEGKLRLSDVPHIPMPKDGKPRSGFINADAFAKLLEALPKHLRPLAKFLYATGCRIGAAKQITWAMVNEDCSEIELPGEVTKNGEALTLPLVGKGLAEVGAMLRKMFRGQGPVFDARNFRKEWNSACHSLGLGVKEGFTYRGLKPHDLRRSAVRNLVRAGVREDVAMTITGHKTRAVFSRYNITDKTDVREALLKVGQYNSRVQSGRKTVAVMQK